MENAVLEERGKENKLFSFALVNKRKPTTPLAYTYEEMEGLGLRWSDTVLSARGVVKIVSAGALVMRTQRNLFHLQRKTRCTMQRPETRQKLTLGNSFLHYKKFSTIPKASKENVGGFFEKHSLCVFLPNLYSFQTLKIGMAGSVLPLTF